MSAWSPAGANIGFAAANNRGVALLAHCDVIALLNPDALPEPGWLAALLAAADAHPDAGSFASRLMLDGQPGRLDGVGDVCHVSGLVWRHAHGQLEQHVPEAIAAGRSFPPVRPPRSTDVPTGCGRAASTSASSATRRTSTSASACNSPAAPAGMWPMPSCTTSGRPAPASAATSRCITGTATSSGCSSKNMPSPLLWRYLPLHLLTWPLLLVWFAARGRG